MKKNNESVYISDLQQSVVEPLGEQMYAGKHLRLQTTVYLLNKVFSYQVIYTYDITAKVPEKITLIDTFDFQKAADIYNNVRLFVEKCCGTCEFWSFTKNLLTGPCAACVDISKIPVSITENTDKKNTHYNQGSNCHCWNLNKKILTPLGMKKYE